MNFHPVDEGRLEIVLRDVGASSERDIPSTRRLLRLLERCVDAFRDEVEGCASFHLEGLARVMRQDKDGCVKLERALTWPGLQRICEREGVVMRMSSGRMPRPAQLVPFLGGWTIVLNRDTPYRRHTYLGVHELGHLWLHHDKTSDRWERVFNMDEQWQSDPREDDAEIFASLVLAGPARPYIQRAKPIASDPRSETHLRHTLRLHKATINANGCGRQ